MSAGVFNSTKKFSLLLFFFLTILSACTTAPQPDYEREWVYTDLRFLDPSDAQNTSSDLVALYTRDNGSDLQIRIDFLDQDLSSNVDIYLAIDSQTGGTSIFPVGFKVESEYDRLLKIPHSGGIRVLDGNSSSLDNQGVRVFRDPIMDTVVIKLPRLALLGPNQSAWSKPRLKFQAFITPARSQLVLDKSEPFHFDARPPDPVQVFFAFWNTFPAYNPSMAMRKWDGAHTGPMGGRHGLFNLLEAAEDYEIPLALLDAASPNSLSALDFLGGLDRLRNLQSRGLVLLPLSYPSQEYSPLPTLPYHSERIIYQSDIILRQFNLPQQTTLYKPSNESIAFDRRVIFGRKALSDTIDCCISAQPEYNGRNIFIPIYDYANFAVNQQADYTGPTLNLRKSLINSALSPAGNKSKSKNSFIPLGGDLPSSTWGVPVMARDSFRYIRSHPWIKVLDFNELISLKPRRYNPGTSLSPQSDSQETRPASAYQPEQALFKALEGLPDNQLSQLVWQAYLSLFNPIYPLSPDLTRLRGNYLSNLWSLILAAKWVDQPYSINDCTKDVDHDGENECLLSSDEFLLIVEPQGGILTFSFYRSSSGVHQFIGPSSQLITGTSDPLFWNLSGGIFADPNSLPGAFSDKDTVYNPAAIPGGLMLTSSDGALTKFVRIKSDGIRIDYRNNNSPRKFNLTIPFLIDPWQLYQTSWRDLYFFTATPDEVLVGTKTGPLWRISTSGKLHVDSFTDSLGYFGSTEDPNKDYPRGHFLPFPIIQVNIASDGDFYAEINVDE